MNNSDITVLVVDDEEDLRKSFVRNLQFEDFHVLSASSGEEAFQILISAQKIDFVLSDVRMANGDGVELLEKIRSYHKDIPVVLLVTGFTEHTREEVVAKGAIDMMPKPVDIDRVIELIKSTHKGN